MKTKKTYFDDYSDAEVRAHTKAEYEEMIKTANKPEIQLYTLVQDDITHPKTIGVSEDLVETGLSGFVKYVGYCPTPFHNLKRKNVDLKFDGANLEWRVSEDTERLVVAKVKELSQRAESPEQLVSLLNENKVRDLNGATTWSLSRVLWFLDNYRIEVESGPFIKALKAIKDLRSFMF